MGKLVDSDGNPLSPRGGERDQIVTSYRRVKAIAVAVVPIFAAIAAVLSNFSAIGSYFSRPEADLIIDDFHIEDASYVPVFDIVVRNRGSRVATINEAIVVIDEIITHPTVFGETGLKIDATYDAVVAVNEDVPINVKMPEVDRKVPADDVDKIRLRLSVTADFGMALKHLCAYSVTLKLRFNGDQEVQSERHAVLYAYAADCFNSLGNGLVPDKRKSEMLATYQKLLRMEGVRSNNFQDLLDSVATKLKETSTNSNR